MAGWSWNKAKKYPAIGPGNNMEPDWGNRLHYQLIQKYGQACAQLQRNIKKIHP